MRDARRLTPVAAVVAVFGLLACEVPATAPPAGDGPQHQAVVFNDNFTIDLENLARFNACTNETMTVSGSIHV